MAGRELPRAAVGAANSNQFREGPDKFVGNRSMSGCWRMRQGCPLCGPVLVAAGGACRGWWRVARLTHSLPVASAVAAVGDGALGWAGLDGPFV